MSDQGLMRRLVPWGFIMFAGTAWGLSFSLAKIVVEDGAPPLGITYFQAIISAIVLFLFSLTRGRPLREIVTNIKLVVVIALFGAVIPSPILYIAADHLQAGILAITIALIPMITYGASIPLKMEKFSPVRVMGLALGVVAIMLISLPENSLPDPAAIPWILFALIAVFCYSAENIILAARSAATLGPIRLALGMNVGAVIMLTPLIFWRGDFIWPGMAMTVPDLSLIGLGVISLLAYTMFIYAISLFGPVFASQTGYIVTFTGVIWGMIIFGESHSLWVWGALLAMIIGLVLVKPTHDDAETAEWPEKG